MLRAPRQDRPGHSADRAGPGCRARLVRNVAVEYRLLATNNAAQTRSYDRSRAATRPASRAPSRFGAHEPDRGQQRQHDDEVGQVAQRLRQFERGEPRRPHQIDRHLAGHRVADGRQPHQADALLAHAATRATTAASTSQPSTITSHAAEWPTARRAPSAPNPTARRPDPARCRESPTGTADPTSSPGRSSSAADRPRRDTAPTHAAVSDQRRRSTTAMPPRHTVSRADRSPRHSTAARRPRTRRTG